MFGLVLVLLDVQEFMPASSLSLSMIYQRALAIAIVHGELGRVERAYNLYNFIAISWL